MATRACGAECRSSTAAESTVGALFGDTARQTCLRLVRQLALLAAGAAPGQCWFLPLVLACAELHCRCSIFGLMFQGAECLCAGTGDAGVTALSLLCKPLTGECEADACGAGYFAAVLQAVQPSPSCQWAPETMEP